MPYLGTDHFPSSMSESGPKKTSTRFSCCLDVLTRNDAIPREKPPSGRPWGFLLQSSCALGYYKAAIPLKPTFAGSPSILPSDVSEPSALILKTLTVPTMEFNV